MREDTIAAIATAMAPAGIGIIRISGPNAMQAADRVFRSAKTGETVVEMESHTIHYGHIVDEDEVIDEVLLSVMRAPRTFTREDTIEVHTHGGLLVMRRVLELVIKNGARLAEPGEFTKRAFLNGRIDLTQAESVIDVIQAENDYALRNSMNQLSGQLYEKVSSIRAELLHEIAFIEAALDDPEHIRLDGYEAELSQKLDGMLDQLQKLVDSAENGRRIKEGIRTVIVGKPNAGKSSLLNALLGEDRAIVTEIPGTTRDLLGEQVCLSGITLNITDTAGIRQTDDPIEAIGVSKAREALREAELVLYVVDSAVALDTNDFSILEEIRGKKMIVLLNKSDLPTTADIQWLREHVNADFVTCSAKERSGIKELKQVIEKMFFEGGLSLDRDVYISNVRQKEALSEALDYLSHTKQSLDAGMPEDFLTIDMMAAYDSLSRMIGENVDEDLVNEIFSFFCMGK